MKQSLMRGWVLLFPVFLMAGCGGGTDAFTAAAGDVDLGSGIVMTADGRILLDVPRSARPAPAPVVQD
jgi:hypothetical protein